MPQVDERAAADLYKALGVTRTRLNGTPQVADVELPSLQALGAASKSSIQFRQMQETQATLMFETVKSLMQTVAENHEYTRHVQGVLQQHQDEIKTLRMDLDKTIREKDQATEEIAQLTVTLDKEVAMKNAHLRQLDEKLEQMTKQVGLGELHGEVSHTHELNRLSVVITALEFAGALKETKKRAEEEKLQARFAGIQEALVASTERLTRHDQRFATQKATELTYLMSLSRLQSTVSPLSDRTTEIEKALAEMGARVEKAAEDAHHVDEELAAALLAAQTRAQEPEPAAVAPPPEPAAVAPPAEPAFKGPEPKPPTFSNALTGEQMRQLEALSSEVDQFHIVERELRQGIGVVKQLCDRLQGQIMDQEHSLGDAQLTLRNVTDTVEADLKPYAARLKILPDTLSQFERKLEAMAQWQGKENMLLQTQLETKADKAAVLPIQKALMLLRDTLFDGSHRKCAAGRSQYRCLSCDKLPQQMASSSSHQLPPPLNGRGPDKVFKWTEQDRSSPKPQPPLHASGMGMPGGSRPHTARSHHGVLSSPRTGRARLGDGRPESARIEAGGETLHAWDSSVHSHHVGHSHSGLHT